MKLYFKQKFFSWFDSYDIYNEENATEFIVKGELSWGHLLKIYDYFENHVATIKEVVFSIPQKYEIYKYDEYVGEISKQITFISNKYKVNYRDWHIEGDIFGIDYFVVDGNGNTIATISKKIFNFTDTYELDIVNNKDALDVLLIVLAIDIYRCGKN